MTRAHTCHAVACVTPVPPRLHMCPRHWRMVPRPLQSDLLVNYRPGQERTMTPTAAYMRAAAACVRAVAEHEGLPEAMIADEVELYETWAEFIDDGVDHG